MAHIGKRLQISPFIYIMKATAVMDFMLEEELHVPTGYSPGIDYGVEIGSCCVRDTGTAWGWQVNEVSYGMSLYQ